ncbi:YjbH domain-containing protein [Salinisphaera sp. Q1T1-3]|nr:YjbH domain-containing protein [Salinisphaera sp. Q1T1-3]
MPVSLPAPAKDYTGDQRPFQANYGGTGLMETPTARMAPVGEFSFTYSNIDPYSNYAFSFQPFSWLQGGFRYTSIAGRQFNADTPDRDYLDKGVDLKLRLLEERTYRPQIALGFRDFGGTGLFSSEFLVANKRFYDFDFSFGLAWGYLGHRGDIDNPLGVFGGRFDDRVGGGDTGDFNLKSLFTGQAAFFGGIQYHTPFEPLTLQLEYEGNDYSDEPRGLNIDQDLPVNVGARLRVNDNLTLSGAFERGNTAMFGATLNLGLAHLSQPKSDPAPVPIDRSPSDEADRDWAAVSRALASNAGIRVRKIKQSGDRLIVEGAQNRYRQYAQGELRANRILNNVSSSDISSFQYRYTSRGFYLRQDDLPRAPLPEREPFITQPTSIFAHDDYRRGVKIYGVSQNEVADASDSEKTLYDNAPSRFTWNIRPTLNQNYGGPDGYLYQIRAEASAEFRTDDHGWISGTIGYSLIDNFDKFNYIADSDLPRVRTFVNEYTDQTDLGIYNLQYTRTARLGENWFAMGYAGLLEQMYGGAGGEVLYRPFNSPVALGVDVNYVRQRDFDTQFDFRDYDTVEGHATAYINTGIQGVLARVSAGRYLAKDYGATLDLSRRFESGVRLGAYATYTSASVEDKFGEGGFDKGIYISIPLDTLFTKSTQNTLGFGWSPLTRDGGAFLNRRYSLYGLTSDRSLDGYWRGYEKATGQDR